MCVTPLFIPAHSTHSFNRPYTYILSVTLTHSLHRLEEVEKEITWGEVARSCCVHDAAGWFKILLNFVGIAFCLYWFIFSLELLSTGAKVLTGCAAGSLFGDNTNPVASLIVGILVTVMLQSSSTTTSIIVSLVGAGAIPTEPAIYMVMGANIGT